MGDVIGTLDADSYRSATHGMIDRLPELTPEAQLWQRLSIMQNVNALCDEVDRLRAEVRRLQSVVDRLQGSADALKDVLNLERTD